MKYAIGGLTRFSDNPSAFATTNYSTEEKNMLLAYMQKFGELCGAGGYIDDLKTGDSVYITNAFYQDSDGYTWSKQDMYHIEKYDAAVSEQFFEHAQNVMKTVNDAMDEAFRMENVSWATGSLSHTNA